MLDFDNNEVFESFENEFKKKKPKKRSGGALPPWGILIFLLIIAGAAYGFKSGLFSGGQPAATPTVIVTELAVSATPAAANGTTVSTMVSETAVTTLSAEKDLVTAVPTRQPGFSLSGFFRTLIPGGKSAETESTATTTEIEPETTAYPSTVVSTSVERLIPTAKGIVATESQPVVVTEPTQPVISNLPGVQNTPAAVVTEEATEVSPLPQETTTMESVQTESDIKTEPAIAVETAIDPKKEPAVIETQPVEPEASATPAPTVNVTQNLNFFQRVVYFINPKWVKTATATVTPTLAPTETASVASQPAETDPVPAMETAEQIFIETAVENTIAPQGEQPVAATQPAGEEQPTLIPTSTKSTESAAPTQPAMRSATPNVPITAPTEEMSATDTVLPSKQPMAQGTVIATAGLANVATPKATAVQSLPIEQPTSVGTMVGSLNLPSATETLAPTMPIPTETVTEAPLAIGAPTITTQPLPVLNRNLPTATAISSNSTDSIPTEAVSLESTELAIFTETVKEMVVTTSPVQPTPETKPTESTLPEPTAETEEFTLLVDITETPVPTVAPSATAEPTEVPTITPTPAPTKKPNFFQRFVNSLFPNRKTEPTATPTLVPTETPVPTLTATLLPTTTQSVVQSVAQNVVTEESVLASTQSLTQLSQPISEQQPTLAPTEALPPTATRFVPQRDETSLPTQAIAPIVTQAAAVIQVPDNTIRKDVEPTVSELDEMPLQMEDDPTAVPASPTREDGLNPILTLPTVTLAATAQGAGVEEPTAAAESARTLVYQPTRLPDTGFADQWNIPMMILVVMVLLALILSVRLLRNKK